MNFGMEPGHTQLLFNETVTVRTGGCRGAGDECTGGDECTRGDECEL